MSDRVSVTPAGRPGLRGEFRPSYRPQKNTARLPDIRQLGIIAACCAGAGLLVAGAVELAGHRHTGLPVVMAPEGPVRIKPLDAGGMKLNGTDMIGPDGTQSLGPAAEEPQIDALRAQLKSVTKQLARQAAENVQTAKIAQATAKIVASPAPAQAAAIERVPAEALAPPPEPGVRVQLAAYTDSAAAYTEWQTLSAKWPDLLGRRRPEITRVDTGGRIMWRLRTGPFAGVAQANAFCTALRARGSDCAIAAY
jgi:hypothetical protein